MLSENVVLPRRAPHLLSENSVLPGRAPHLVSKNAVLPGCAPHSQLLCPQPLCPLPWWGSPPSKIPRPLGYSRRESYHDTRQPHLLQMDVSQAVWLNTTQTQGLQAAKRAMLPQLARPHPAARMPTQAEDQRAVLCHHALVILALPPRRVHRAAHYRGQRPDFILLATFQKHFWASRPA